MDTETLPYRASAVDWLAARRQLRGRYLPELPRIGLIGIFLAGFDGNDL
jgi:hypothetical protein